MCAHAVVAYMESDLQQDRRHEEPTLEPRIDVSVPRNICIHVHNGAKTGMEP